jgi:hypothetical protein
VSWKSSGQCWSLKYDGAEKFCGVSSARITRIFSGGEASSSANAIGVSGCLINSYQRALGGAWYTVPSHYKDVEPGGVYWVTDLSVYSWQVGGNN